MKLGDGVSGHLDPTTGRVKVMWCNREEQPDGTVRSRQRKVTVDSMGEARKLGVEIEEALGKQDWFEYERP